ncbi:MAG: hypothetical protein C0403_17005, partial [Desulfobacterium sp.]|nr:hypothetical protein [Desulfobacterium sp.]
MFVISILISRFLGAKGLGNYTLIFTIGSIGGVIGCLGFNVGIFRYIAFYREKKEYYKIIYLTKFSFAVVLVFSMVVGLNLFFLADTLAAYFEKIELVILIKMICFFIPLWALGLTCFDAIRGYQDFYKQNLIEKVARPSLMIGTYFLVLFFGGN